MRDPVSSVTSVSLLARIASDDRDPAAWAEFVERYGKRIYEWCLNRRLQPADAEDVTQDVLVKLASRLGSFEYDQQRTFRGWLRRITENAVADLFREHKTSGGRLQLASSLALLDEAQAQQDLAERLNDAFDLELFEAAKSKVRARVDQRRWLAWELTAVQQQAAQVVSEALDMKVPTVYSNRYQVQKMIADEVRRLEARSNTASPGHEQL